MVAAQSQVRAYWQYTSNGNVSYTDTPSISEAGGTYTFDDAVTFQGSAAVAAISGVVTRYSGDAPIEASSQVSGQSSLATFWQYKEGNLLSYTSTPTITGGTGVGDTLTLSDPITFLGAAVVQGVSSLSVTAESPVLNDPVIGTSVEPNTITWTANQSGTLYYFADKNDTAQAEYVKDNSVGSFSGTGTVTPSVEGPEHFLHATLENSQGQLSNVVSTPINVLIERASAVSGTSSVSALTILPENSVRSASVAARSTVTVTDNPTFVFSRSASVAAVSTVTASGGLESPQAPLRASFTGGNAGTVTSEPRGGQVISTPRTGEVIDE